MRENELSKFQGFQGYNVLISGMITKLSSETEIPNSIAEAISSNYEIELGHLIYQNASSKII